MAAVRQPPVFFASASDFRAWLEEHHATAIELTVGYHKIGSGHPCMTWPESVDEALCFGWIDGVRRRIDDATYQIRFTPRRSGSIWSAVNVAKVEALIAQGRMRSAGLAAFAARRADRTAVYAFERTQDAELNEAELREFKGRRPAWAYFESTPPSYRRTLLHWITCAKRPETRARRLAQLIEACAERRRLTK